MAMERRGLARGLKVWLNVVFVLTAIGSGGIAVLYPIAGLSDQMGFDLGVPVAIGEGIFPPIHRLEVSARATGDEMAEVHNPRVVNARGELRLQARLVGFSLTFWAVLVAGLGAVLTGLNLLRKILDTTAKGSPFHPDNARRLNTLGWLITGGGIAYPLVQFFLSRWILERFSFTPVPLSPAFEVPVDWILCGLLVLVLASIWKEAVRMAEEESLTV